MSQWQTEHDRPAPRGVAVFALERPRDELRARIDRRVVQMFAEGLVEEVRRLQAGPWPIGPTAAHGVGYREVLDRLAGRIADDAVMIERVQARTRQFAKRQMTWFRGLAEVRLWPVAPDEPADLTAERLGAELIARR